MCGIVGIWNQADCETIAEMARSVSHRGPDGLDWTIVGNNSFGASRLAIKGDPHASAIFRDTDNDIVIMLNGEIYNIASIRSELISQGYLFQTDLETEVICQLYKRDGLDFVNELQGMFAIAISDIDHLILIRDHFGIKPLYYTRSSGRILFGSEIKAIFWLQISIFLFVFAAMRFPCANFQASCHSPVFFFSSIHCFLASLNASPN